MVLYLVLEKPSHTPFRHGGPQQFFLDMTLPDVMWKSYPGFVCHLLSTSLRAGMANGK